MLYAAVGLLLVDRQVVFHIVQFRYDARIMFGH